jgi:hypothetical protein
MGGKKQNKDSIVMKIGSKAMPQSKKEASEKLGAL